MAALDVFKQDAFSVITLTDSISNMPYVPGRAGNLLDWDEDGVSTPTIMLEEQDGVLQLINPTPRGGPGETTEKSKRRARNLTIPHYEHNDHIFAAEVDGVRAFGSETELDTVQGLVDRRMAEHVMWKHDPTLEYQRVGALTGIILNANGTTLYNLFDEFGVAQYSEVAFDLSAGSPVAGILRERCDDVDRQVADVLGGVSYTGLHAFCGTAFWKDLIKHSEVREIYLASQTMAMALLNPMAYKTIQLGPITFEEYRGKNGATPFIHTDKCHIFPFGVRGLYRTRFAPADYMETVNTKGLPRYAKQYEMPNGKGVHLDTQMNALSYCNRPKCLIKGKRGA